MSLAGNLEKLAEIKQNFKDQFEAKGVEISDDTLFEEYPSLLENLSTSESKYNITIDSLLGDVDEDGVLQFPSYTGDVIFTGMKDLAAYVLNQWSYLINTTYKNYVNISSISFPDLTALSNNYSLNYAFYNSTYMTSASFPALETVSGSHGMQYAFYGCTGLAGELDLPSLTEVSGIEGMAQIFQNCTGLLSVSFSALTTLSAKNCMAYAFSGCTNLESLSFPVLTTMTGTYDMDYAFQDCTNLTRIEFPVLTSISQYGLRYNTYLEVLDFSDLQSIAAYAFYGCTNLKALILRRTPDTDNGESEDWCCTLSAASAFTSTAIASGTGYIYVPEDMVDTYKAADNWSTYADQITAIEGSDYDETEEEETTTDTAADETTDESE